MNPEERLQELEALLPRLHELARQGELDEPAYYNIVNEVVEQLEALVEAFEE